MYKANFIWSVRVSLKQLLGQWPFPQQDQCQKCKAYLNHLDKSVYYRDLSAVGDKLHRYPTSANPVLSPLGSNYDLIDIPSTAFPTRISANCEWQLPQPIYTLYQHPPGPLPGIFSEFLSTLATPIRIVSFPHAQARSRPLLVNWCLDILPVLVRQQWFRQVSPGGLLLVGHASW